MLRRDRNHPSIILWSVGNETGQPGTDQVDPWLARLPPEVRSAIRANSQRTPPRGYEERMHKYFRNIE